MVSYTYLTLSMLHIYFIIDNELTINIFNTKITRPLCIP